VSTRTQEYRYHSGGTRAEQLRTGAVASDRYHFEVVWKGAWYQLGSLSDHIREKVDPAGDTYVLYPTFGGHRILAPKREVAIPDRPIFQR
jgi:hypothetical protein